MSEDDIFNVSYDEEIRGYHHQMVTPLRALCVEQATVIDLQRRVIATMEKKIDELRREHAFALDELAEIDEIAKKPLDGE